MSVIDDLARAKLSPTARRWQQRLSSAASIPPGAVIGSAIVDRDWWMLGLGMLCFALLRIRTVAVADDLIDVMERELLGPKEQGRAR